VAAKGITQSQVNGAGFKAPKPPDGFDPFTRIAEIFSSDDGTTDIGDFQYLIFNLVTAAYFVSQFLNPDGSGLPAIPDTLLGLTSVSAGLYVGEKAVTRTQPLVTGVFPPRSSPRTVAAGSAYRASHTPSEAPEPWLSSRAPTAAAHPLSKQSELLQRPKQLLAVRHGLVV
jgi:hypothetical protein